LYEQEGKKLRSLTAFGGAVGDQGPEGWFFFLPSNLRTF
jgi:hypothetical protein